MAWPLNDSVNLAGYSVTHQLPVDRTEMEQGAPRYRRRSSSFLTQVSGQAYCPDSLLASFNTWLDVEANMGATPVDIPLNTQGVVVDHLCRVLGVTMQKNGAGWTVQLQLETDERNLA